MAKYYYDKKALKGLTPFPFLGEVKTRNAVIEAAPTTAPRSVFNANILAGRLHPAVQHCLIRKVEDHGDAKSFTLIPDAAKGTEKLAYFRASQYVIGKGGLNVKLASMLVGYTIDVFRELDSDEDNDDVSLDEFTDAIEPWIIDELKKIGFQTAKGVLGAQREMIIQNADLEEETVDEVLRILQAEFE